MKNIITIQHTQSEQHTNKMIGSWADWRLTELGIEQAENIGKHLSKEITSNNYSLYSSDLLRAKQTAEIVSNHLRITPVYSNALREFNLGDAIGKTKTWARNNQTCSVFPNTVAWAQNIYERPFEKAETKAEVWHRVSNFLNEITKTEDNIIIVSHDGTLSILYALWLGLDMEMLNKLNLSGKTGGVSFLSEDENGNRIISGLNDMSYILNI